MRTSGQPVVQAEFDEETGEQLQGSDAAMILHGGNALQRTQTQYSGAIVVQRPRERKAIQKAVIEEAELAGEDFFYSWTTQNKDGSRGLVEGISIEGAMIMARNYGNCAIPTELAVDAPGHWVICATFVDLETGFNVPRLFRQRKNQTAGGRMDKDRAMDIAFQIGQSKAQRNAIDKAMPTWLKEKALAAAKAAAEGKYKDVPAWNEKAVKAYAKIGVTQAQLEEKLGLKIEHWTSRDHVSLDGLYRAIRDRQTTVADEFPTEPKADPAAAATGAPSSYDAAGAAPTQSAPAEAPAAAAAPATPPAAQPAASPASPAPADAPKAGEPKQRRQREPGED